jgi:hypothetical protein
LLGIQRARSGARRRLFWQQLQERELRYARREPPQEQAQREWDEGLATTLDEAIAYVLAERP